MPRKPIAPPSRRHDGQAIYFKVLSSGARPIFGDPTFSYPLPTATKPGGWAVHKGELAMCEEGLHVTDRPEKWLGTDKRLFLCQVAGRRLTRRLEEGYYEPFFSPVGDKIVVSRLRLLKELNQNDFWTGRIPALGLREVIFRAPHLRRILNKARKEFMYNLLQRKRKRTRKVS